MHDITTSVMTFLDPYLFIILKLPATICNRAGYKKYRHSTPPERIDYAPGDPPHRPQWAVKGGRLPDTQGPGLREHVRGEISQTSRLLFSCQQSVLRFVVFPLFFQAFGGDQLAVQAAEVAAWVSGLLLVTLD